MADVKKYRVKGRRTLADGTVKEYYYMQTSKYKPVDVDRRPGNSGAKCTLSPEQKEEVWQKHLAGVTMTRICKDVGVSYSIVKRYIDKKKAEVAPE